ncbi:CHASE domain-containing protein [Cyanobium sp. T1B-Tous]|uniref:CHASE domain-containing protein n=1 Tax=Cyanobium sp. T1B-Tous TaxID=2823721 RepID=UPI0020CF61C7|nr:CHASE domain-containing protein [Cyanobium sp. T1B-Tous]MCP9805927.1 CHASE domain-containing protein [Cyanobium sp. T1B-Tous]
MDGETLVGELRRTMGRLDTALGQIDEGMVLVNAAGTVQWSNAPFDALVGRPRLTSLGQDLHSLLPLNIVGEPMLTIEQTRGGITKTGRITSILSRDPIHALEVEWRPINTEEPNPFLFLFRDISARFSLEELQRKINQVEQDWGDTNALLLDRRQPTSRRRSWLNPWKKAWTTATKVTTLPWIVLASGLLITAGISEQARRFGFQEHLRIESNLLDNVVDAIQNKLEIDISVLGSLAGLFNASNQVSRSEFSTFYQSITLNTRELQGVQGIGFARWIPATELTGFERRIRTEGFPDFSVRPPGPRQDYSAIEFLEPFDWRNQRAFGYDMYSDPVRREAMQRAAQSGRAALSGKVRLVQETEEDLQRGALIYLPVYADKGVATQASKRNLVGWAYSPLRLKDLVKSALDTVDNADLDGTGVLVFDGDQPLASNLLFDNQNLLRRKQVRHPSYERLNIAGRSWLVGVQLSPKLVGPNGISPAFWLNLLLGASGSAIAALITQILIRNHLATKEALAISEKAGRERALASTVFEESGQAIVVSNPEGRIVKANSSFSQLTGYRISEIKGQRTNLLKSGRHDAAFYKAMWDGLLQKGFWEGDVWNRLRSGEVRRHHLSITTVRDESLQPRYYVGMLQDVTERHQAEEAVRFMAQHDTLTGLANRAMLMEQLERQLALAKRHGHGVALLYLDLDGFKPVNDRFGHNMGDQVLQIVAERFRKVIRDGDLLCRQGGDEFVVLVPEAGSTDELLKMGWKLVEASRAPYSTLDPAITISASVGVARYPDHGNSSAQLLTAADNAMYAAKRAKGDAVQLCNGNQTLPEPASGLLEPLDDHRHQHQGASQGDQQGDGHG